MVATTRNAAARPIFWAAVAAAFAVVLTIASWVAGARLAPAMGFRETYFDGATPGGAPRLERVTKNIDLACLDENPSLPRRNFRVRWEGIWHVSESRWTDLYLGADDRGVVTLDGRQMIERNAVIGMGTERVRFLLTSGDHHLVLEYQQDGGDYHVGMLTGPAGDAPHSFADEAVYPSTPGRKTLAKVQRLTWLRRSAVLAWWLLAFALFVTLRGQWFLSATRGVWRDWLARHRLNWRRWRQGDSSAECAGAVPADLRHRPAVAALYVVTVVAGLALFANFYDPRTGFTPLIMFGSTFSDRALPEVRDAPHYVYENSGGYDGQFYAQLAVRPSPRNPDVIKAIDAPPVRMRRMLFSWSAFLLGLGRPAWVLQVYAVQNIGVWLLLALLLCRWLPPVSVRHWLAWSGCLFAHGLISSVRCSLTDGPSLLLVAMAIASAEKGRPLMASAILGLSGLARESNVLAAPGCLRSLSFDRRLWAQRAVMALLMVAPPLLWLMYLRPLLGPEVFSGAGNIEAPFAGLFTKLAAVIRDYRFDGWSPPVTASAGAILGLSVQIAYLAWRMEWRSAWWRAALPYVLLTAILSWPVWTGTPGAFTRALLPIVVAFNVLIPSSRWFWPLCAAGNLSVVTSVGMLLSGLPR